MLRRYGFVVTAVVAAGVILFAGSVPALAQEVLDESFDSVVGGGTGDILIGAGYNEIQEWDDGIVNEHAYAGTWGAGDITSSTARGVPTSGLSGSGGGRLTVTGSADGWYAGMMWPGLTLPTLDLRELSLFANVRGSVPGGAMELRLEANDYVPFVLDEDFDAIAEPSSAYIFDEYFNPFDPTGWTDNYNDALIGEEAFAGVTLPVTVEADGGVVIWALDSGGTTGGAVRVDVSGMTVGAGGEWWAGLSWRNRQVPPLPLDQIFLTADIQGTVDAAGEQLGNYVLRLEDEDNDWLVFANTADGSYQSVGGALSDAVLSGDGFSNGDFNLGGAVHVAIVMWDNGGTNWNAGGTLTVDNVFLTGGATRVALGSVAFTKVATGAFQAMGGMLSNADSGLESNVDESFSTVVGPGTGDGMFYDAEAAAVQNNGFMEGIDDGIEGESAFAGYWGSGITVKEGVAARGNTTGDATGGGCLELEVTGMNITGAAGWYAGVQWLEQSLATLDMTQIEFRADIKAHGGTNGLIGKAHLRISDADMDWWGLEIDTLTTDWQSFGGAITAGNGWVMSSFPGQGNGSFGTPPFTAIIAFYDEFGTWGNGGMLSVDNVFLTSPEFGADAADFSVHVVFANTGDWGTGGSLTVDTLRLAQGPLVPAVSAWGLVVMLLLVVAAGSVVLRRREAVVLA